MEYGLHKVKHDPNETCTIRNVEMTNFVRTCANNSNKTVYHSNEDCHRLQQADDYRETNLDEINHHELTECTFCSGDFEPSTNPDLSYQKALKQAAKDN